MHYVFQAADLSKYDHDAAMSKYGFIDWGVNTTLNIGDVVFLYFKTPEQKIRYKTVVEKIIFNANDICGDEFWKEGNKRKEKDKYYRLKLVDSIDDERLSYGCLKDHGVISTLQGSEEVKPETLKYIESVLYDKRSDKYVSITKKERIKANLEVHPKSVDILDVTSKECCFKNNIDVLNECFGAKRSLYMNASYPQKRNDFIREINTNDKIIVWMPKLYGNSSQWKNSISDDGTIIYEIAEEGLTKDWMDTGKHDLEAIRLVFVKESPRDPYRFVGAFKSGSMKYLNHTYIRVATKVRLIGDPVLQVELMDDSQTTQQLEEEFNSIEETLNDTNLNGLDKMAIVKTRINQGVFRDKLIRKYGKCCLCGVDDERLLIASHIKPWADSSPDERTDEDNGLLLCPNHDKLFDKGYISFDDEGYILISKGLSEHNLIFTNIHSDMKISLSAKEKKFMRYHREAIFIDNKKNE